MKSLGCVLIQCNQCPYKKGEIHRDRHTQREGDVKTKEISCPQTKEHLWLTEARRGPFSLRALRRNQPWDALTSEGRPPERKGYKLFSSNAVWYGVRATPESRYTPSPGPHAG